MSNDIHFATLNSPHQRSGILAIINWFRSNYLVCAWIIPFLAIPPVIGWLTGWLVGSSQSPVVSSVIPLLFGVGTALSYMFSDRHTMIHNLHNDLLSMDELKALPTDSKRRLNNILGISHLPAWLPVLWTMSAACLAYFTYIGTQAGIEERVKTYPSLETLTNDNTTLTPDEYSLLAGFRLRCISSNISPEDLSAFFHKSVSGVLGDKHYNINKAHLERQASRRTDKLNKWEGYITSITPRGQSNEQALTQAQAGRLLVSIAEGEFDDVSTVLKLQRPPVSTETNRLLK